MATNPELLKKVTDGIGQTGYPLEQRVGHCLRMRGWHPFHAVTYWEPQAKTHRELDILAFKDIHNRRIELRISCKRSTSKQWIFFTEDTSSVRSGSDLKITPVTDNRDRIAKLPGILRNLPFFRPQRPAINFTALAGNKQDKEAKSLVRDGLLSSLSSVYWQPYPYGLLDDTRGIVYLFITVFDGLMFESFYDPASDQDQVEEIEYVQWRTDFPLWQGVKTVTDHRKNEIPLWKVLFWFSNRFRIEIVTWKHLPVYLDEVEAALSALTPDDLTLLGNPWNDEYVPNFSPAPRFEAELESNPDRAD